LISSESEKGPIYPNLKPFKSADRRLKGQIVPQWNESLQRPFSFSAV